LPFLLQPLATSIFLRSGRSLGRVGIIHIQGITMKTPCGSRPISGGTLKQGAIWISSEDNNLKLWASRVFSASPPVFAMTHGKPPINSVPSLLIIRCDYNCRLEACSTDMCLPVLYPGIPTIIARPVPLADGDFHSPRYFASYLSYQLPSLPTGGIAEEYLPSSAIEFNYRGLHPLSSIFLAVRVCENIIVSSGKIAKISDLRHVSNFPSATLSKKFKKASGVPLKKFINKIRLCHCLWELLWTSKAVKCIALDFGYKSTSFSSKFHKTFGVWPSQARSTRELSF
jgi:AraC-like DNA-binding protein